MTCFFWFETIEILRKAETWTQYSSSPIKRLASDATPTNPFRKWVVLILTTTQVSKSVVMLALLFIYRLKTLNPTVKGKAGSEYRLLTVALMLGNKCTYLHELKADDMLINLVLDDNTYTNKTWAEVSGISVGEIHVMEVEFLSNMRYSLLATRKEWDAWQKQLGKFVEYIQFAAKAPLAPLVSIPVSPGPNSFGGGYLPSPTATAVSTYQSSSGSSDQQYHRGGNLQPPPHRTGDLAKKRSFEDIVGMEPAPKRPATIVNRQVPTLQSHLPLRNIPHLPAPNLSISTNSNTNYAGLPQSLPPLPAVSGRAVAQVYPSTPNWTPPQSAIQQHQPAMTMSLPPIAATKLGYSGAALTSSYGSGGSIYSLPSSHQGTPSRRHSPRSVGLHSMNSSPITGSFAKQDLNNYSPSIFLQQRNSPYKPVRPPNKLLYPPPGAYQEYYQHHQPGVEQMHYQPLGKRNDYRTGVVPEYRGGPEQAVFWQQPFDRNVDMAPMNYAAR